ncbi:adenosine kinase [Qipengyuania sp. DY56-A-20]|mgnify:FL=1|jgi:sugar/nucleoside kinase (ribokinase family)|uniref:Adenosine kinase n=1 Tax=Qipengyuania benthica TaxID=3067651 RepID=A0ABT9H4Z0_9SPHN|nr:adenosine kinase [Qipengyuania sp. DY56-A-20]MDP4538119.1 adenosine kinase [Qipengyuania sp. DY56-A-20]
MTDPRYDVIAIGNAIVDVMAPCEDALIEELGLNRGGMTLVDTPRANELYDAMGPAREISGGSAANTLAGMSALGAQCAFIGQVADDQLGQIFGHDIRAGGIDFDTPPRATSNDESNPPTARCLIFVTPDGERTMNTFLGASQFLPPAALDDATIASAAILYLEGYLWDPEEPRRAMRRAIEVARNAGRKVAFTASESFVIERHGDDFRQLIEDGMIDILFVNEGELATLTGEETFEDGVAALKDKVPVLVATRGPQGAIAIADGIRAETKAEPVERVVDTTGAGDLFAAGFLTGHARGDTLETCLRMGAICAAEVISHYGARPEADLKALVEQALA